MRAFLIILSLLTALTVAVVLAGGLKLAGLTPFVTWRWVWITSPLWGLWLSTVLAAAMLLGGLSFDRLMSRLERL